VCNYTVLIFRTCFIMDQLVIFHQNKHFSTEFIGYQGSNWQCLSPHVFKKKLPGKLMFHDLDKQICCLFMIILNGVFRQLCTFQGH
jgi:hypothetical protein